MTLYYVASTGDNSDGLTWAKAFTTFAGAVSAATGNGDTIYVDQGFTDTLSADTTYTFGNNVNVICSNDKSNAPPQTLGVMGVDNWIGHSSTSYAINMAGGYKVSIYGITFRLAGTAAKAISLNITDNGHFEYDNCYIWLGTTSTSTSCQIILGSAVNSNYFTYIKNSVFRFGHVNQFLSPQQRCEFDGCSISSAGETPGNFIGVTTGMRPNICQFNACDLSLISGNLIAGAQNTASAFTFSNCKINASLSSVMATQTPANKGAAEAWLFNCSGGDTHYHLQHHNAFGSTVIDTGIYANDGASYDGTNRCSWKIFTSSACSYYTPYVSPWIDCYHAGTSAITPSLEIVRSGSATAYQDDEVWAEFSYQGTSGNPLALIVSDRKALLAAAADQTTGALDASGWTGENATSWFGKLNPTSAITPAEIGHLRARIVVGEPSTTVYLDPTIRGRS